MAKTVLITGASGGIGLELARIFAQDHYNLVLVARNAEKLNIIRHELEEKYQVAVKVICKDLVQENAPEEIFDEVTADATDIDILVNNAGFGDYGPYIDADWNKQRDLIQLNIVALIHMTKLFVKPMAVHKNGKILNVASIASFEPGPLMSVYYASKAFVLSFSEALSKELEQEGITVTALCPGPTETGFEKAAALEESKAFKILKPVDAAVVAQYGYRALMKGKTVAVQGAWNRLLVLGVKFAPRKWVRQVVFLLQGKKAA